MSEELRKITVTRQKRFSGAAIPMHVVIDDVDCGQLDSIGSLNKKTFTVDSSEHKLYVYMYYSQVNQSFSSNGIIIEEGMRDWSFVVNLKWGLTAPKIILSVE